MLQFAIMCAVLLVVDLSLTMLAIMWLRIDKSSPIEGFRVSVFLFLIAVWVRSIAVVWEQIFH